MQRVLIIDDQRTVREGIARLIRNHSSRPCHVAQAATHAEALRVLKVWLPHVVVLDVDLAGEDGLALLPHLRRHARVLVLTSHGDAATRERARLLGADGFVAKDAPAAVLLGQLAQLTSRPAPQSREEFHPAD